LRSRFVRKGYSVNTTYRQKHLTEIEGFVPRPSLVAKLLGTSATGLAVLAAPGGFGKTWLTGQVAQGWAASLPSAAPVRIWTIQSSTTVTQALRTFCALFGQSGVSPQLDPDSAADAALEILANNQAEAGPLIIDMDGVPPAKAVQSLIGRIVLEHVVHGRTLVACRSHRNLPIDRVSMCAPLKVFTAADLALSIDELGLAQESDSATIRRWIALTEGWPVLCGHPGRWRALMAERPASDVLIDRAVGMFGDYMEHSLLAHLAACDIKLLMQVSIFESIDPGILAAVELGLPWMRLAHMVRSGLPVSSHQTDWDRVVLHPVLRRFLERRMLATAPSQYRLLNRRAANYFAAAGSYADAIRHAAKTGDPLFGTQITEQCGGWRISWRGGIQALEAGSATTIQSDRFPKAALARIYWQLQSGRIDEARHALVRLQARKLGDSLNRDLQLVECVIAVYCDAPFDEVQIQRLADLRAGANEDEPLLFPSGATLQAAMLNDAGLYDRAGSTARAAIECAEAAGERYVAYYGRLQHASALHGLGRVAQAIPEYLRARALAEDVFGDASRECRMVTLLIAHATWLSGNEEQAERVAGDLSDLHRLHTWFEPYARMLQIAIAISRRRGDRQLEERVLEDFFDLAERRCLPRLKVMVQLARAQRASADGRYELADSSCDAALRTLADMPVTVPDRTVSAARVFAPVWLEKARIAVARGHFDDAAQALRRMKQWSELIRDGALNMEGALLDTYIALRGRRYRDVTQSLSQCVADAEHTGLTRPFLNNASVVMEVVEYARIHALKFEAGVLQRAAELAGLSTTMPGGNELKRGWGGGRLLLTDRESDILNLLVEGLSAKEMARRLQIAEGTIKTHRRHLYEKLNCGMRSQVINKARELGLL
jgi:LuxR family transcriptional regulator, maltose regulon positive regulatory protein